MVAAAMALASLGLAGCAETQLIAHAAKRIERSQESESKTEYGGTYKVGKPYQINGVWYYPSVDYDYDETGVASWYGPDFHGKSTANGEVYNQWALTAAHRTLPMPSFVRVTNLENGRSLVLRVNDRGPFAHSRILDVSKRAAQLLDFHMAGTARVRVQILSEPSREIALRAQGGLGAAAAATTAAPVESPIIVEKAPKELVASESLAPPPGASVSKSPKPAPVRVATAADTVAPVEQATTAADPATEESVAVAPVSSAATLYVQAGAFSQFDNANRVSARLAPLGPVRILPVQVNGKDIYRVRMGPLETVDAGDRMLEDVIKAGFPDAKLIVD